MAYGKSLRIAAIATLLTISVSTPQIASAYTLSNDNGGDGYVTATSTGFDLFGSDNSSGANYTAYTQVSASSQTVDFSYVYKTFDCCGSYWDPAGYVVGGVYTQITPSVAEGADVGATYSGSSSFAVAAGETYGFYVYTQDGEDGRGELSLGTTVSPVPLPSSAPMFAVALLALGAAGYGAQRKKHAPSL